MAVFTYIYDGPTSPQDDTEIFEITDANGVRRRLSVGNQVLLDSAVAASYEWLARLRLSTDPAPEGEPTFEEAKVSGLPAIGDVLVYGGSGVYTPGVDPKLRVGSVKTIGLLGASTEQNCGDPFPLAAPYPAGASVADYGYLGYALYKLAWAHLRFTKQGGISGQTSNQIAARAHDFFTASDCPDAVILGSGLFGNDFSVYTLAQSKAQMEQIFVEAKKSGKLIIYQTAQPHDTPPDSPAGESLTYFDKQAQLNQYGRDRCRYYGFVLHDVERITTDALTGKWRKETTGGQVWTGDGLHPYRYGALRIGESLAAVLTPYISATDSGPASALDVSNILGTKGFFSGAGPVATGWSVANAGANFGEARVPTWTTALTARTDFKGNWQKVALTAPGAVGLTAQLSAANFAIGDTVEAAVEVKTDGDWNNQCWGFGLIVQVFGSTSNIAAGLLNTSHSVIDKPAGIVAPDPGAGVLKTPPISRDATAPGQVTFMSIYFWAEVGSFYVSRARFRKVV